MLDPLNLLRSHHQIAGLRVSLRLLQLQLALKANFNPLQHRDRVGKWDKVSFDNGGAGSRPTWRTGDPKIDRTTNELFEIARDVAENLKLLKDYAFGSAVHAAFALEFRRLNLPGIGRDRVETSFSLGRVVRYGFKDGVRTDVIKRDGRTSSAPIIAVWDVKTGGARLTAKRVAEIREHLGLDDRVPIFEIHIDKGVTRKSLTMPSISVRLF